MFILSQDKKIVEEVKSVRVERLPQAHAPNRYSLLCNGTAIGRYPTEESARAMVKSIWVALQSGYEFFEL